MVWVIGLGRLRTGFSLTTSPTLGGYSGDLKKDTTPKLDILEARRKGTDFFGTREPQGRPSAQASLWSGDESEREMGDEEKGRRESLYNPATLWLHLPYEVIPISSNNVLSLTSWALESFKVDLVHGPP
ncbi:hypothetical protein AMTR_s00098p00074680 [Amborella trichopoda]|uniref:Uncharacterized protein n=1 Tax=Amborella trichopoda TaxID=13333 RepID=W1NW39_AMBTC|nr:hypothetical protein AMTR_s00098p00074680 [Amborella trichopoda]